MFESTFSPFVGTKNKLVDLFQSNRFFKWLFCFIYPSWGSPFLYMFKDRLTFLYCELCIYVHCHFPIMLFIFYWWESFHIKKLSTFSLLWTYTSPQLFVICLWHGLKWRNLLFLCSQIYLVLLLWLLSLCETVKTVPSLKLKRKKSCFLLILSGFGFYV